MHKKLIAFLIFISFLRVGINAQRFSSESPAALNFPFYNSNSLISSNAFRVTCPAIIKFESQTSPLLGKSTVQNFLEAKIKTSGKVSAIYNYGLQPFNPKVLKPIGYVLYKGTATLNYDVIPVNINFQYTDCKDYYGIAKYFRVNLDTRQLKQNILNKAYQQKNLMIDSLNKTKKILSKEESKLSFMKYRIDSLKMKNNENLLKEAQKDLDKLVSEENQEYKKINQLKQDSLKNYGNVSDTAMAAYADSINISKEKIKDIQLKRNALQQDIDLLMRLKKSYDSLQLEIKHQEKYCDQIRSSADGIEKNVSRTLNSDSIIKQYFLSRLPRPKSTIAAKSFNGIAALVTGIKTLEVGMCNPNYSPFLINGTSLKGINLEWQNHTIYLAITYGKTIINPLANLQRNQFNPLLAVRNVYNYFDFNNDTLTRKVFATKFGIGSIEGNHLFFGFLSGTGSAAIASDTSIHHKIERNGVNEIDAQIKVGKSNTVNFLYAKSSLLKLQSLGDASLQETLTEIYKQQYNSSALVQWNTLLNRTNTSIVVSVRLVQPYYESFGLSFLISDNLRYELQIKQSITNRLKIAVTYRYFQDNLLWLYGQRNLMQMAGLTMQYKINRHLTTVLMVNPANVNKKASERLQPPTGLFKNNSLIANCLIKYIGKKQQFDISNNFYKLNYDTSHTVYNQASIAHSIALSSNTQWKNELLHFYSSGQDTQANSCFIFQSGIKTSIRNLHIMLQLRSSYNKLRQFDYGYNLKLSYNIKKHLVVEVETNKYVGGNFLLGFNDSLLRKYPYTTMLNLSYQW